MSDEAARSYRVSFTNIERELNRQMKELQASTGPKGSSLAPIHSPLQRARMSNLVIFCNSLEQSILVNEHIPSISAVHPSRTILLVGEPGADREPTARVTVRPIGRGSKPYACAEQVTVHASGNTVERLPFAVRALIIGDLPVNLWWVAPTPPPLSGALLYELAEYAQQIIYDSIGWPDPARGVAATAAWLEQIDRSTVDLTNYSLHSRWRVASDINWRRLKYWRRLVMQTIDEASAPGAAASVREVVIEHGPHAVVQAWLLASWLSRVLGWRVQAGMVTAGVEMAWRFMTPRGEAQVHIRRLDQGPAEVRRLRLSAVLGDKPVTLDLAPDGEMRLATSVEGLDVAPRTITVPPQNAVDLIGRQLSDRERDVTFRESMAIAGVMAQSLLH